MMATGVPDPPPYFVGLPSVPLGSSSPRSSLDLSTSFGAVRNGGIFRESSCPDRVSELTRELETRLTLGDPFCTISHSQLTTPLPPPPPPPAQPLTPTELTPTGSPGPQLHLLAHQLQVLEEQRLMLQAEMRELQQSPADHEEQLDRLLARFTYLRLQADDLARRTTHSIDKRIPPIVWTGPPRWTVKLRFPRVKQVSYASTDSLEESFMGRSRRDTSSTCSELLMASLESNGEVSPSNNGFNSVTSSGGSRSFQQLDRPRSEHVPGCIQQENALWKSSQFKRRSDSATSTFAYRPNNFPGWETVRESEEAKSTTSLTGTEEEEGEGEEAAEETSHVRNNLREEMVACGHPVTLYREEVYLTSEACRGYLEKMGGRFKTWRRRWFVFDREKAELRYYLNANENRLKGSVPFVTMNDIYVNSNPPRHYRSPNRRLTFCLGTSSRTYYLVADSSEVMRIWMEVLLTAVITQRNSLRPS